MSPFLVVTGRAVDDSSMAWRGRALEFIDGFHPDEICEHQGGKVWALQGLTHSGVPSAPGARVSLVPNDGLFVVLDGWLENHDDLASELIPTLDERTPASDLLLIRLAYRKWGRSMASRLYGEYAIVVWDARAQTVFAVRDKVGIVPLFHARCEVGWALSNLPGLLAALPSVGTAIDDGALAEFLCVEPSSMEDTLYKNVKRVLGGRYFEWSNEAGAHLTQYWKPSAGRYPGSDEEFLEEFASTLKRAVKGAARVNGEIGCEVSGGIDSSSVAVTLANLLDEKSFGVSPNVTGISQIYPGESCDESEYIDAVALAVPFGIMKRVPRYACLDEIESWTRKLNYPAFPFVQTSSILHWVEVRSNGIRVVLTGEGGDELFFPTENALRSGLLSINDFPALWRYLSQNWSSRPRGARLRGKLLHTLSGLVGRRMEKLIDRYRAGKKLSQPFPIDPRWRDRVGLDRRLNRIGDAQGARCVAVLDALTGQSSPYFEFSAMLTACFGIENRNPLCSARLLELANRTPLALMDGMSPKSRWPLRRATKGRLPSLVAERQSKAEFSGLARPALLRVARRQMEIVREAVGLPHDGGDVNSYSIDLSESAHIWRLNAASSIEIWLRLGESDNTHGRFLMTETRE